MITITSKQDGFRRCGKAHAARPTEYSNSAFSKKELAILQDEQMLVVVMTEDKTALNDDKKNQNNIGK